MQFPNISFNPNEIKNLEELSKSYIYSATTLYANAHDIGKMQMGEMTALRDYYLIVCIYLLRHGTELAMKALYYNSTGKQCKKTHDIRKIFAAIPRKYSEYADKKINAAFAIFNRLDILQSEELFRYIERTNRDKIVITRLQNISCISKDDFELLIGATNTILQVINEVHHENNGLSFREDYNRLSYPIKETTHAL